jgi:hypothetical protein
MLIDPDYRSQGLAISFTMLPRIGSIFKLELGFTWVL